MFPFRLAYVKSDLLSIYIPTQKSCDRVLRQAVNYDNRHNKNSPSVDGLMVGCWMDGWVGGWMLDGWVGGWMDDR